jgi:hypothetical protein
MLTKVCNLNRVRLFPTPYCLKWKKKSPDQAGTFLRADYVKLNLLDIEYTPYKRENRKMVFMLTFRFFNVILKNEGKIFFVILREPPS